MSGLRVWSSGCPSDSRCRVSNQVVRLEVWGFGVRLQVHSRGVYSRDVGFQSQVVALLSRCRVSESRCRFTLEVKVFRVRLSDSR